MVDKKMGSQSQQNIWAIVPAAGVGKRMLSKTPKQYLPINHIPILQHTLERLLSVKQIEGIIVAVSEGDEYWSDIRLDSKKPVLRVNGGEERCHSVINAMHFLAEDERFDNQNTLVMVHDAVRPCVAVADIEKLIIEANASDSGALLAVQVRDTMKRQDNNQNVAKTVDRDGLWHALTPQCFSFTALLSALELAEKQGFEVTDESSAMENAGFSPKLVASSDKNIKITRPDDLKTAEYNLYKSEDQ